MPGNLTYAPAAPGSLNFSLAWLRLQVMALLGASAGQSSGSLSVSWLLPALNEDGTAIGVITGQTLYYDTVSRMGTGVAYANSIPVGDGSSTSRTLTGLSSGTTYYFATTVSVGGVESNYSMESSGVAA